MAIFYVRTEFTKKGKVSGNAVRPAAYIRAANMECGANGKSFDYTGKDGVVATGLVIPKDAPAWVSSIANRPNEDMASAALWTFVEEKAPRIDAQLASNMVLALPRELSLEQNTELAKAIGDELAGQGFVVDWAFHNEVETLSGETNPHLHILTTLRPLVKTGFGPKRVPVLDDDGKPIRTVSKGRSRIKYTEWSGGIPAWKQREKTIEVLMNKHLAMAGHDLRVDCRSNAEKGNGFGKSIHIGPARPSSQIVDPKLKVVEARAEENRRKVRRNPGLILNQITEQKAVFTVRDINRVFRKMGFAPEEAKKLKSDPRIKANLVVLEKPKSAAGKRSESKLTTRDMQRDEHNLIAGASRLNNRTGHGVREKVVEAALSRYEFLSDEQRDGVRFLTSAGDLKSLVGLAGTGKSTLLRVANDAWEQSESRSFGVTLSGKAADELQASSGIESRTLASFSFGLGTGKIQLSKKDIIVLDEAGMVGSRDMENLIKQVEVAGAKLVLVGDPKQLPAISAGAAFHAILQEVHSGWTIETIRRQESADHRRASQHFASFEMKEGLQVYSSEGAIHAEPSLDQALEKLSSAFVEDYTAGLDVSAITFRNVDVRAANSSIRWKLKEKGKLGGGIELTTSNREGETHTAEFSPGDKIVFLKNDKAHGVRNGTTGIVISAAKRRLAVMVGERVVVIDPTLYNQFAHGYAVTIHKSQGASVDHVHVLASEFMDRNLTYVAMTRHKKSVKLYHDEMAFKQGLSKGLSRANDKTSTRDYVTKEAIIRFGERRGLNTAVLYAKVADFICRKIEGVWTVIERQVVTPKTRQDRKIEPAKPLAMSVHASVQSGPEQPLAADEVQAVREPDAEDVRRKPPTMAEAKAAARAKKKTKSQAMVLGF